jgi:hypothetical protein
MKRIFLLITAPFIFLTVFSAEITQEAADRVISVRMDQETRLYTVYAKKEMQAEGITITTSAAETLELDYPCWIYYIRYADQPDGDAAQERYLIVNGNNENLLEINPKGNAKPEDLIEWRIVFYKNVPHATCSGEYTETMDLEGAGYLFVDFFPDELQREIDIIYVIYNKEYDSGYFSVVVYSKGHYSGNICNFPDFAKEWEINSDGKQIYFQGKLHIAGIHGRPAPADLTLINLK